MARTLRILATAGALDSIAPLVAGDGIIFDPVLVDEADMVEWRGARCAVADAAPEIAWFSPELFQRKLTGHFLAIAADAPSIKWMQSARAGYNDRGLAAIVQAGVALTTSDGPAVSIAEYVLAQVLDVFQRGPKRRAAQVERRWHAFPFQEIGNSRWVIHGFGAIGREIAIRARAFGTHVTGVRRSGGSDDHADAIVTPAASGEAMAAADVVILAVPLSRATENIAGTAFFAGMKPGALLVNVGRGALVDEEALRLALDAGRPGQAVLDVTRIEPLPKDSWIWRHPAITLTPHLSGWGDGMLARTQRLFADNIRRFVTGAPLRNQARAADVVASEGLE